MDNFRKSVNVINEKPNASKKGLRIEISHVVLDENNNLLELSIRYSGWHTIGGGWIEVAQRNKFELPEK